MRFWEDAVNLLPLSKFSAAETLELPIAERLALVEEIRDTIAAAPEALTLTVEDERLEAGRLNPKAGSTWEQVYARIVSRRK